MPRLASEAPALVEELRLARFIVFSISILYYTRVRLEH